MICHFLLLEEILKTVIFTTNQQKEFTRKAHATVVITDKLPLKSIISSPKVPSLKEQRRQMISVERLLLQNKVQLYKNTLIEVKDIITLCNQEKDNNFDIAIREYHERAKALIEESIKTNNTIIDARTQTVVTKALAIEPFSFQPQKPVDINSILNQLTEASKEVVERDILCICKTLPEVVVSLGQSIKNMEKTISILDRAYTKTLKEAKQKKEEVKVPDIDYNFVRLQPSVLNHNTQESRSITMVVNRDIEKTDIASMSYTVTFNNAVSTSGTTYKVLSDTETVVSLFPEEIEFPSNAIYYDITGNLITTDGREVAFDKRVSLSHDCNYGEFKTSSNTVM